jgi:hypothetical protein
MALVTASESLVAQLRRLKEEQFEGRVDLTARAVKIDRSAITRILAGEPVRGGTIALLEAYFAKNPPPTPRALPVVEEKD